MRNLNLLRHFFGVTALVALVCLLGQNAGAQVVPPAQTGQVLPNPLTLADAIAIGLKQQPQDYSAQTQVTSAQGQKTQALAQYLPTVTPEYEYQDVHETFYGTSYQVFGGSVLPITGASTVRGGTTTLSLNQKVLDSGLREVANAQARRTVDAAKFGVVNQRQETILAVAQAYFTLLEAIDLVKVAQAQVDRAQQTLDLTQGQIDAGTLPAANIYQAKADLATAQVTLIENDDTVHTSSASLKNAMGVETDADIVPAPLASGAQLPPPPSPGDNRSLDDYVGLAYAHRPDLLQQSATVQVNQLGVKQAKINAGASVEGTAGFVDTPQNDVGSKGTDTQVLLTVTYPLFDGGASRAAVREAQATTDASKDQLATLRQQIRLDVEQAYVQRTEALKRVTLAESAVAAAQVSFDSATAQRKEGVGTVVDITTAEVTLTQAQDQYVTAVYDFYSADAALNRAIGNNDNAGR